MNEKKIWNGTRLFPRTTLGILLFLLGLLLFACQPQVVEVEKIVEVTREVEVEVIEEVEVIKEVEVEVVKEVEIVPTANIEFGSQPEIDATGSEEGDGSPFAPDSTQKVAETDSNQIRLVSDQAESEQSSCATFVSSDFTDIAGLQNGSSSNIPGVGILQLTIWYDGSIAPLTPPSLEIELESGPDSSEASVSWLSIGGAVDIVGDITRFERLVTREYRVTGCQPTGRFQIEGVVADGNPDGLAFGLYYQASDGLTQIYKSADSTQTTETVFVGIWPVSIEAASFKSLAPQLTTDIAEEQAKALIYGAQLLPDGLYELK